MKKKRIGGVLAAAGAAAVLSGLCTGRAFCLDMESYAGLLDKERMSGETEYMVSGDQECRRLLMELVSAGAGKEREEFFITGEDYEPETLVIAQMFPAAVNISNTKIEEYEENGRRYVTCRIGFERQPDQEACTHRWETRILEAGTCLWGGKEELTCRLCGLRKVRSPAALGHLDADRDRLCDRCRDPLNGDEPIETGRWAVGDIQTRRLGKETYQFRCVDDDYSSAGSEHQKCALFLCETVIRSDMESTDSQKKIITFGKNNNYKDSEIRKWLRDCCTGEAGLQMGAGALKRRGLYSFSRADVSRYGGRGGGNGAGEIHAPSADDVRPDVPSVGGGGAEIQGGAVGHSVRRKSVQPGILAQDSCLSGGRKRRLHLWNGGICGGSEGWDHRPGRGF